MAGREEAGVGGRVWDRMRWAPDGVWEGVDILGSVNDGERKRDEAGKKSERRNQIRLPRLEKKDRETQNTGPAPRYSMQ